MVKPTQEQETELVEAIKDAFGNGGKFDELNIYWRAGGVDFPRLTAAIEAIIGPKARCRTGWHRGRMTSRCRLAIMSVRKHFALDDMGWWSIAD
jgi:hypothetical protein